MQFYLEYSVQYPACYELLFCVNCEEFNVLLNGVRDPMLSWFEDYLTGHFQSVALDGVTSTSIAVTSGVPQGSILVNVS